MNAIWVANDNLKDGSFTQTKAEVLCTVSNLAFVKHFYPNTKTILFVDDFTKEYYNSLGVLNLFDEVNDSILNRRYGIDPKIFWAYSKILAQRSVDGPTITFDLDFRIFTDISKIGFFDGDVSCLMLETITDKYFYSSHEKCLNGVQIDDKFPWDDKALNVCLLYFGDNDFKNLYCDWVIDYMYQVSFNYKNLNENVGDNFILFAEQYMLNQLANRENKTVRLLVDDYQEGPLPSYVKSCGVNWSTIQNYIYHFGTDKRFIRKKGKEHQIEVQTVSDITNYHIKDNKFLKVFNDIVMMEDDQKCFG